MYRYNDSVVFFVKQGLRRVCRSREELRLLLSDIITDLQRNNRCCFVKLIMFHFEMLANLPIIQKEFCQWNFYILL